MSISPLDEQKCSMDIQMSIRPLDEKKFLLDIQKSIRALDEQKCQVDIQMSIRPFNEWTLSDGKLFSYPHGVTLSNITLQLSWYCKSCMSIGHKEMSIYPLDEKKCPLDIQLSMYSSKGQTEMSIGH